MAHYDHHVFSQANVHNELIRIKSDFCSVFLLVIIPNNYFVPLICIDKDDYICFVHHFYDTYFVAEVLNFFLEFNIRRVILDDFKACFGSKSKIFLTLIGSDTCYL